MVTGSNSERRGRKWMSNAIASCYYHTKLAGLTRPFRERYCLARRADNSWRIQKRRGPTVRILYYHRVNDDGDGFFPATPKSLFEREMEYLARHYQVVSLDTAANHLEGSSSEPVVAVTFDDGYRDNYENAFPILDRYGIPATIFLTTGPIDTGEPLWFERLSLALKKTKCDSLDLETDPPMRFPLGTLQERLACNDRVQSFLREVGDEERRDWLDRILQLLKVSDDPERDGQMLTWEQIRSMKAHGIDFGGHTITHPFLSRVTGGEALREISGCKRRIEAELQEEVRYFAYPHGHEPDVSPNNREQARRAGYRAAVTTIWGINDSETDRMQLRRGGPWEDSPALFAYKFDWYQLANE